MHPVPLLTTVVRVLPLWLAWLLVVVLGRLLCHVAQRIPPVVRLVRRLRGTPPAPASPLPTPAASQPLPH